MGRRVIALAWLATVLVGCATTAPTAESKDRDECRQYARRFADHQVRMKDACLISRGYRQPYSTVLGELWVRSTAQPRQPAEVVAADLKACNDATKRWSNEGWAQFANCMTPRGYAVSVH
jgi:hypothetical protein